MSKFAIVEHLGRGRMTTVAFAGSKREAEGLIESILLDLPGAVLSIIRL